MKFPSFSFTLKLISWKKLKTILCSREKKISLIRICRNSRKFLLNKLIYAFALKYTVEVIITRIHSQTLRIFFCKFCGKHEIISHPFFMFDNKFVLWVTSSHKNKHLSNWIRHDCKRLKIPWKTSKTWLVYSLYMMS